MAPNCPEEVDVFSIPHSRMKELVKKYLNMVSEINFADTSHLTNLLESLVYTFEEFKAHERIENKYIMKKLKEKLKALSIRNTALCNCHSDNRLTDMLELVQDGYKCTQKTETDRKNFGIMLRKALEDFTEVFLPHMEEEEEVFQPMLIKYFSFDELRQIKCKVLEKHFCHGDKLVREKEKEESCLSDSSDEESSEKLQQAKDGGVTSLESCIVDQFSESSEKFEHTKEERCMVDRVPNEITLNIFSYLNPKELVSCAQVSYHWNRLALDGSLWKNLLPVQWSKGNWIFESSVDVEAEEQKLVLQKNCDVISYDEDADVDESEENNDEMVHQVKKEGDMLTCMIKYLLPRVGCGVKTINLAYSKGLVNGLLFKILQLCPNVENLFLSHTRISDLAFKSLGKNGCGSLLKNVDLAGCYNITDRTLDSLSKALSFKPMIKCEPDDIVLEEKNEIESNEKGIKSTKNDNLCCHSACNEGVMFDNTTNKNLGVESMKDIEDHIHKTNLEKHETSTNFKTSYLNVERDISDGDSCLIEKHPRLTLNDGMISSSSKSSMDCCFQSAGVISPLTKALKHHTEIQCHKHLNDTDVQQRDRTNARSDGMKYDNTCDNSNCGLEYLNLSGCFLITDKGLRSLVHNRTFPMLQYLDLSGCEQITSDGLTELVSVCTALDHQYLYYCENITEDPYFNSASGCQNLECAIRSCCRTGY